MPLEDVMHRVTLEAHNELRLHEDGDWWMTFDKEHVHNLRVEEGERCGHEECCHVVQYIFMQPYNQP